LKIPKGVSFDKAHSWAFTEQNGNVKVGIDDFLSQTTGKLTKLEMKKIGDTVQKGDVAFTLVQNGKHLSIKSPISGKIVSCNEEAKQNPELILDSPFNKGWIYMLEPLCLAKETQYLMNFEQYRESLTNEFARIKDFFASFGSKNLSTGSLVLQDGGELRCHLLQDFGPEAWEDFQSKFLDN
jgi:glycine cleavage system H protein